MRTVILGAGNFGQYVAESLSQDGHSVTLVDTNHDRLEEASQKMDVATKLGAASDWRILDDLMRESPELLLALTDNDEVNLVACTIAKSYGKLRCVARIQEMHHLGNFPVDIKQMFHVDHIVVPDLLVANKIIKITSNECFSNESFFQDKAHLRTITIPQTWKNHGKSLRELCSSTRRFIIALIRRRTAHSREDQLIFPHGTDVLLSGDEVTLIGDSHLQDDIYDLLGQAHDLPSSVVVMGATLTGILLAKELYRKGVDVRLVDTSKDRCYSLAKELPQIPLLYHPSADWDFFKNEKIDRSDACIACTCSEEKNMQLSLIAKDLGCPKVISVFSDKASGHLAEKLGISHVVSPYITTTDHILTLTRGEKLSIIVSLYDQKAEIIGVRVSENSKVVGDPLATLGPRLPSEMLIALILSEGKIFAATGQYVLKAHDEVLIICHPKHRKFVEKLF